jgi:3-hydroxy-9,10-secoandrosta-1,3,5(10)-triene-9,17-dione monooxygenase reductase component
MPAPLTFRRVLGRFTTGVTLVTAPGGESLVVNAFMPVSLEPPLVAFSAGGASLTWRRMRPASRLGINALDASVDDVRVRARPGTDRLAGRDVQLDPCGVPRVATAVAVLLAEIVEEREIGDRTLVTGAVIAAERDASRRPLVFFGGEFGSVAA